MFVPACMISSSCDLPRVWLIGISVESVGFELFFRTRKDVCTSVFCLVILFGCVCGGGASFCTGYRRYSDLFHCFFQSRGAELRLLGQSFCWSSSGVFFYIFFLINLNFFSCTMGTAKKWSCGMTLIALGTRRSHPGVCQCVELGEMRVGVVRTYCCCSFLFFFTIVRLYIT